MMTGILGSLIGSYKEVPSGPPTSYTLYQTVNASLTFTVPAGKNYLAFSVMGPGSAGTSGNVSNTTVPGNGGSGGSGGIATLRYEVPVTAGVSYACVLSTSVTSFGSLLSLSPNAVTANAGISGGNASGTAGSAGGDTTSVPAGANVPSAVATNVSAGITGLPANIKGGYGGGGGGQGAASNVQSTQAPAGATASDALYAIGGGKGGNHNYIAGFPNSWGANGGTTPGGPPVNKGGGGGGGGGQGQRRVQNQGGSGAAGGSGAFGQILIYV